MALATDLAVGEVQLTGDLSGDGGAQLGTNPQLTHIVGLTPGQYINPKMTVDAKGRTTAIVQATPTEISSTLPVASSSVTGAVSIGNHLNITPNATKGYQDIDLGGTITGATVTSLDACANYSFGILLDGVTPYVVSATGTDLGTIQDIIDEINADTTNITATITQGNVRISSDTLGRGSMINVTDDNMFRCIPGYVGLSTPVDGTEDCELFVKESSDIDYGVVKIGGNINVTNGVISVATDLDIASSSTVGAVYVPTSNGLSVNGTTGQLSLSYASLDGLTAGAIKIGSGLDIDANGVCSVDLSEVGYTYASETNHGIMQVGNGLDVTNGVVSVNLSETVYADATESTKGIMQVGNGLDVTGGVVSVDLTELTIPDATVVSKGIVQIGSNINVSSGIISVLNATSGSKGVVQAGSGLSIASGVLSLSTASAGTLGGVIIGAGLTIDGSGIVSADAVPDATAVSKGVVQIGSNIDVTSGVISVPDATAVSKGAVQIGSTLSVTGGEVNYFLPNATTGSKGGVQIGSNIDVASGVISVPPATNTTLGVVNSADTNNITIDGSGGINIGPNVPSTSNSNTFTAAQIVSEHYLSSSTNSVIIDASLSNIFKLVMTENTTLENPINLVPGQILTFVIAQDAANYSLAFGSMYKFRQGIVPVISATLKVDIMTCVYDGTNLYCTYNKGW